MRKRARTDLCGGRSVMIVPTATAIIGGLRSPVLISRGHGQRFAFFRKQYGEEFSWLDGTRVARNGVKLAGRFHPHLAGRVGLLRFIVDL